MDKLICDKYANALFELAKESNKCEKLEEEVVALSTAIADNPDFKRLLSHPDIDGDKKLEVISAAFGDMDIDLKGFISLVFARGRGNIITGILDSFVELTRDYRGVVNADIVSAVPLSDAQLTRLVSVLEKKLGKTVEVNTSVDSTVLGGLKITVCGKMIDSTLKSRLDELKGLLVGSKTSEERRDAV
jgi:F-type H+-transporting ATPase subunit delta